MLPPSPPLSSTISQEGLHHIVERPPWQAVTPSTAEAELSPENGRSALQFSSIPPSRLWPRATTLKVLKLKWRWWKLLLQTPPRSRAAALLHHWGLSGRESGQQGHSTSGLALSAPICFPQCMPFELLFPRRKPRRGNKRRQFSRLMSGQGESHGEKVAICVYSSPQQQNGVPSLCWHLMQLSGQKMISTGRFDNREAGETRICRHLPKNKGVHSWRTRCN